jgi:predicted Zn finger-like uncharacterized protein
MMYLVLAFKKVGKEQYMAIRYQCPHCDTRFRISDQSAGRLIVCTGCQRSITVPSLSEAGVVLRQTSASYGQVTRTPKPPIDQVPVRRSPPSTQSDGRAYTSTVNCGRLLPSRLRLSKDSMLRPTFVAVCLFTYLAVPVLGDPPRKGDTKTGADPIAAHLLKDKEAYIAALKNAKEEMLNGFDKRYESVKNNRTLKVEAQLAQLETIEAEKQAFDESGTIPTLPGMKVAVSEYRTAIKKAKTQVKTVFEKAARAYLDNGDVKAAAAVLEEFKELPPWNHLDLGACQVIDDFVRLKSDEVIGTRESFDGPFEVTVVARTAGNNIRLHGPGGSSVIFNWENNPRELRVHLPAAAPVGTAAVLPLVPGNWYTLKWRATRSQVDVWVDGKPVYSQKGEFQLKTALIQVRSCEHVVDVRSLVARAVK